MKDKLKKLFSLPPHFQLWALISLALVIFLLISFAGGLNFGLFSLKQASFKDTLLKTPSVWDNLDDIDFAKEEQNKVVAQTDSTVKSIFIFGDSMTSLVARRLAQYGEKNGYTVFSVTKDGATTSWWSDAPDLDEYMAQCNPDFIVVVLGANEAKISDPSTRVKFIDRMIERFKGKPFIWIGPPHFTEEVTRYEKMLYMSLPKGTLFRTDMSLPTGPDHIHPTPAGGVIWTDSIMRWVATSRHPILNEVPDQDAPAASFTHIYIPMKGKGGDNKDDK